LREKRGCIYWCFVDLEDALDSINRALQYKTRKKGVTEEVVESIKVPYDEIQFRVKWCGEEVTEPGKEWFRVRQRPYLLNIFLDLRIKRV
jgi:hypothetical protein